MSICFDLAFCLRVFLWLELSALIGILTSCRSTSFIARNAKGIARFWFARAVGRERSALIADLLSYPSAYLCLHLLAPSAPRPRQRVGQRPRVPAGATAGAASTGTESTWSGRLK